MLKKNHERRGRARRRKVYHKNSRRMKAILKTCADPCMNYPVSFMRMLSSHGWSSRGHRYYDVMHYERHLAVEMKEALDHV